MVDIAVPLPENVEKKRKEKLNKYLPLANEVREIWNMEKVVIIPVIIGATGEVPKTLHPSLEELSMPPNTYLTMQKSVLLDTCSIVRKFLSTNSTMQ